MTYDIIFVTGEVFFDHPFCGIAILKRLLEQNGYKVAVIEKPDTEKEVKKYGSPNLFFGVTSGCVDSMVKNYTPLKKLRKDDEYSDYDEPIPDRAVIVYSNWIKKNFKNSKIVLGGTEASLRRFVHYDYWDNKLRRPILFDSRAEILVYGNAEKQILEIAGKIKNNEPLLNIKGTCIITKGPVEGAKEIPSYQEVLKSKDKFCEMQTALSNNEMLQQQIDNRYALQYKCPTYASSDLDQYYELGFTRKTPKSLRGFEFSVVTHRGCIGKCNFCAVNLIQGDKIISRSEDSIIREIKKIVQLPFFKGNIDDLGGPSANMYGMDCNRCNKDCIDCKKLVKDNQRLIRLLKRARKIDGVKKVYIKSGVRFDLASSDYIQEIAKHHIFDTLRIAPEHVNRKVLKLMNKDKGNLNQFVEEFKKTGKALSFYFMIAHPGCGLAEAKELALEIKKLRHAEKVQIFTPTPMTLSTAMYYSGSDPKTGEKIYVPYTYSEKKEQKRMILSVL